MGVIISKYSFTYDIGLGGYSCARREVAVQETWCWPPCTNKAAGAPDEHTTKASDDQTAFSKHEVT